MWFQEDSFIGGQGPSYGSVIIKLKDWEERSMMQNSDIIYATLFMRAQKIIKDAQVLFFAPPMIPGYSVSSDIELNMQDKTGGSLDHFFEVVNNYRAALEARPEINSAKTTFNPSFPQYQLDIDAAACKKAGISPSDILSTMQGYFGGLYASNFNRFGKMYRVMIQAEPDATKNMTNVIETNAPTSSLMASIEASRDDLYPWSNFAWTPSTTTMASSTTIAMASTIADRVNKFTLNPISFNTKNVAIKATGIAIAGINVERISCKNTYTTMNTKINASIKVLITSWIDAYKKSFAF